MAGEEDVIWLRRNENIALFTELGNNTDIGKNIKASEGMQMKQLKEDIALLDEKLGKLEDTVRTERKEMDAKLAELMEGEEDVR